ncbi:hypothetical protein GQ600_1643 [Phytophthora cactorum]|nr:hypothetical protein GQ600_1643 [Phytophthora cactorum]
MEDCVPVNFKAGDNANQRAIFPLMPAARRMCPNCRSAGLPTRAHSAIYSLTYPYNWSTSRMHFNGISANANEITRATTAKSTLIHDAVPSLQVATRELSDEDAARRWRRRSNYRRWRRRVHSNQRGFVNGAPTITRSNTTTELNTTTGLNTIGVTHYKEKKCNRILNWWKRLFSDKIKECPEEEKRKKTHVAFEFQTQSRSKHL